MIDSDSLKMVNDSYGHDSGNRLLKMIVQCIQSQLRETDYIARYGGDEFVVLLPKPLATAPPKSLPASASASSPRPFPREKTRSKRRSALHRLLSRSWQQSRHCHGKCRPAMYTSKAEGRNRTTVYSKT